MNRIESKEKIFIYDFIRVGKCYISVAKQSFVYQYPYETFVRLRLTGTLC